MKEIHGKVIPAIIKFQAEILNILSQLGQEVFGRCLTANIGIYPKIYAIPLSNYRPNFWVGKFDKKNPLFTQ